MTTTNNFVRWKHFVTKLPKPFVGNAGPPRHSHIFRSNRKSLAKFITTQIMLLRSITSNFLQNIPCHIGTRLKRHRTNLALAKTPKLVKQLRSINTVLTVPRIKNLIGKIKTKQNSMIMGTTSSLPILPTMKETHLTATLPETFHKQLKMSLIQRQIPRQMLGSISKSHKTIVQMQGRLMHHTHGPLSRTLQTTANTLTTRQIQPDSRIINRLRKNSGATRTAPPRFQRVKASHLITPKGEYHRASELRGNYAG
ncbi:hypothetical protein [Microviridae sp.]|nr:hypothetical protein [Microviridae sp.]UOF81757.1 hypothetical protein [Microviridae sp.]